MAIPPASHRLVGMESAAEKADSLRLANYQTEMPLSGIVFLHTGQ